MIGDEPATKREREVARRAWARAAKTYSGSMVNGLAELDAAAAYPEPPEYVEIPRVVEYNKWFNHSVYVNDGFLVKQRTDCLDSELFDPEFIYVAANVLQSPTVRVLKDSPEHKQWLALQSA